MSDLRRAAGTIVAVGLFASVLVSGPAQAAACATEAHDGGAWPSYGQNLKNTRSQPDEDLIGPANVAGLEMAWSFSPGAGKGGMQSTPVVANGCVYIGTAAGYAYALNADTGELVWGDRYAQTVTGVCCGGTLFAPVVVGDAVYFNVSSNPATAPDTQGGPHVLKLNANTGEEIWRSDELADDEGAYTNSSAVFFDGMILYGISNPESGFHRTGGFALVDAETGDMLKRTKTIPDDQADLGYAGGGIWSTAAIDVETGYAYAGTAQPSDWTGPESERVNAIVKIDVAKVRDENHAPVLGSDVITNPWFGEIVDSMKGTPDDAPYIDVDFAASPTLYEDDEGQSMVAEFQKSGWLHAGYTRHMTQTWRFPLSPFGTFAGNYTSTATDGVNIFGLGTFVGQVWSIQGETGLPNWVTPVGTLIGGNPMAYANGVVYLADDKGVLNAFDSATGLPLLMRPMSLDTPSRCANAGGGVAIARHTVYSVCGENPSGGGGNNGASGWLIAYRLPS